MAKVLVAEKVLDVALNLLKSKGVEVDYRPHVSREELLSIIHEYDGLIVRSLPVVDEELLSYAKNLRVVGRAGNGVDNIDMDCATSKGIIVLNTPEANSISACELTVGMIICACRNICQANNTIKSGVWGRSRFMGMELRGKTLGIIGLGRIGSQVAQRMRPFGMKIIAYDPYITDASFQRVQAEKREHLEDLLKESDVITIHTPKTSETVGMIGEKELALVKPGLRLINCARGGLMKEDAVYNALKEGRIAAAAFDVLAQEPCTDSPLYELENFIVTPHIGATTLEAQENVGITIVEEVAAALEGGVVPNAVNLPMINAQDLTTIKPYLRLGEILGKFYHQQEKTPIERVEVSYCGAASALETEVITLAVLKGLFEPILKEQVNYVNARLVANSRNVSVVESKEEFLENYTTLLRLRVHSGGKVHQYAGTIFGIDEPRIVEIGGFNFDFAPARNVLMAENHDRPGIIGQSGIALGNNQINIATMQVSRNTKEGRAMMVLTVDSPVGKEAISAMEAIPGMNKVSFIQL